jgi:hypothetical protein
MRNDNFNSKYLIVGHYTCLAVFLLGLIYAITTFLGFLSLKSPQEPIGNPYFAVMEILTILIALLMAISMVAVHYYASPADKIYSLTALLFMFLMAGITISIHFLILSASLQSQTNDIPHFSFFLSFKWFSLVYALDILAWDCFFGLSILFASPVFKTGRIEKLIRTLMIICGLLSLAGLIGVPFGNMQIRNIGIIGYALIAPFIFLLIGKLLGNKYFIKSS